MGGVGAGEVGTSPRMRGKPGVPPASVYWQRNIPAYAGKTAPKASSQLLWWEHPRVCGENAHTKNISNLTQGTSPRMRGKRGITKPILSGTRNIPAYAGKTKMRCAYSLERSEHPRVCGENVGAGSGLPVAQGTSPRMRGKRLWMITHHHVERNIPAYAGKTLLANSPASLT